MYLFFFHGHKFLIVTIENCWTILHWKDLLTVLYLHFGLYSIFLIFHKWSILLCKMYFSIQGLILVGGHGEEVKFEIVDFIGITQRHNDRESVCESICL